MNKLFYVVLHNFHGNEYIRFAVTEEDEVQAGAAAKGYVSPGWSVHKVTYICNTSDSVYTEL